MHFDSPQIYDTQATVNIHSTASEHGPSESAAPAKVVAAVATGSGWVRIEDDCPEHMERVLATYVGVYGHRLVTYWSDGFRGHFGLPTEADELGSQPATHWHRLPALPNGKVSDGGER